MSDDNYSREIIGPSFQLLSNWCSMRCAGCGIHVDAPDGADVIHLGPQYLENVRRNLSSVRGTLDRMGFSWGMVEQSGGEPTHHPQVVEAVGSTFEDDVHKIITNGLTSHSILPYVARRQREAGVFLVISVDHHEIQYNHIRLGGVLKARPEQAHSMHETILNNLDRFLANDIPVVVSSILSRWNMDRYLEFVGWLEAKYPRQIEEGTLVPMPVSLVSFGNDAVGRLNPSNEQIDRFADEIERSQLIVVRRARDWYFRELINHYTDKRRFFEGGESLAEIAARPARRSCEIFRYMISFNFQDEEILRAEAATFEGFSCGVKVLGNIGYELDTLEQGRKRLQMFEHRPNNMKASKKYYRIDQAEAYIRRKERITHDHEEIQMGDEVGLFGTLRRGMCQLDDFDGVWWPFNAFIQGHVPEARLAEYWSLFRNKRFLDKLRAVRRAHSAVVASPPTRAGAPLPLANLTAPAPDADRLCGSSAR